MIQQVLGTKVYRGEAPENFGSSARQEMKGLKDEVIRVVVKIMVPFWVPIIIRHLFFRVPKKGP